MVSLWFFYNNILNIFLPTPANKLLSYPQELQDIAG